jgi:hypothetical protein
MYVIQPHEPMLDAQGRDSPPSMTLDSDRRVYGLQDLAGMTGGEFLRLTGAGTSVFGRIADELSSHYLMGFEPRSGEQTASLTRFRIESSRRGVSIRARPTFIVDDPKRAAPTPMCSRACCAKRTPAATCRSARRRLPSATPIRE